MEDFDAFVRTRWTALLRTAYLLTGDQGAAEDLLQDTLIRAAQRWERITRRSPAESYVRRMLYTQSIDNWRKWHREPAPVSSAVIDYRGGSHALPDIAQRVDVAQALQLLTPRQRAYLVVRFYDDQTEARTAYLLGVSLGTVKSQTRDALARLRELVPELEVAGAAHEEGS